MEKKNYRKFLSALLIALFFIACGRRGTLIPRNELVPSPPEVERVIIFHNGGEIFFKLTRKKISYYKIIPIAVEISTPGKKEIFYVAQLKKTLGYYTLPITTGLRFFRLRAFSKYGGSRFTSWFYLPPLSTVYPPRILRIELVENGVKIQWMGIGKTEGILLYFGTNEKHLKLFSLSPYSSKEIILTSLPLHKNFYFYFRSVITCEKKFFCASPPTKLYSIFTKDIIPPPSPPSLSAIKRKGKIYLYWGSVNAKDLLYYRIYRKNFITEKWKFIGNSINNRFIDYGCGNGKKCYYIITAMDRDGNESAPSNFVVVGGK